MIEALLALIALAVLFPAAARSAFGLIGLVLLGAIVWAIGGPFGLVPYVIVVLWVVGRRRPRPIPGLRSGDIVRVVVEHHYIMTDAPPARPEVAMVWDERQRVWRA